MTTSTQPTPTQPVASTPAKSVWKINRGSLNESKQSDSQTASPQTLVNGAADDLHEKGSLSPKDATHGDGSSQANSTPALSIVDETQASSPPRKFVSPSVPSSPKGSSMNRPTPVPLSTRWTDMAASKEAAQGEIPSQGRSTTASSKSGESRKNASPPSPPTSAPRSAAPTVNRWKENPSSKDASHGEGSSQGRSTPGSSTADEAQNTSPPQPPPAPSFRPAPPPSVNIWKVRQEEAERKRWKESQETPLVPLQMDRIVPKPPVTNPLSKSPSMNKLNGVVKSDGKPSGRKTSKNNAAGPPALEDSEAWPAPDAAAPAEPKSTTAPVVKEPKETAAKEGETREPKEPKEPRETTKKKKWEKLEVSFQYDSLQNRRGRGGKFNRNNRNGGREPSTRGKDGNRTEKEDKSRGAQRSDGEEGSYAREQGIERRAQSLSFDPGHRHDIHAPEWAMQGPFVHQPTPIHPDSQTAHEAPQMNSEVRGRDTVPSNHDHERRDPAKREASSQRSRSQASSREKNSSPSGSKRDQSDQHLSPMVHPDQQGQYSEIPHWEDQDHNLAPQNHTQSNQQGSHARRGRTFRGRNGYSPSAFAQGQYVPPPQQLPFQGYYPPMYPPPMQPGLVNARAYSVPYYTPNSGSRYPQPFPAFPDYSRLGVQPAPVIDDEMKQKIIRQVEYYFSPDNLFKDVYLRKKMDTQGFVPLQVLVQFNRLQVITNDVPTVLHALLSSAELEVLSNSERGPLVRARVEPTKWVYPISERDESARHPGPSPFFYQAHQETLRLLQDYHQQYQFPQPYYFDPQYGFPTAQYRPPEQEAGQHTVNESENHPSPVSPQDRQNRQLSGEASAFVPNGVPYSPMINGDSGTFVPQVVDNTSPTMAEEPDELVDVVEEEKLANLIVQIPDPKEKPIVPALPINGINHKKPEREPESLRSPVRPVTWRFSDGTPASPSQADAGCPTEKKRHISQTGVTESSYVDFRLKALKARETSQKSNRDATQMIDLYQFWTDFLPEYWSPSMYTDFIQVVVEDANQSRRTGLLKLFTMYERVLVEKFRLALWNDFVRLAGEDYRNGHFSGIESVWLIRGRITAKGRHVSISDGDVLRLVDGEIQHQADFDRLRKEVKPAGVVLVPYTTGQQ